MADDSRIANKVTSLMVQLSYMIRGPAVVQRLYGILPSGEINDILELYNRSKDSQATYRMLQCLKECVCVGKWQAFIEALQREDYPYVVSLLHGQHDECDLHVKQVLQVFRPYLELQIDPRELIDALRAGSAINDSDVQEILACHAQKGAIAATAVLLDRLKCRRAPSDWYFQFLKVLYSKGYKTLVNDMEPEFTLDCEVLKCHSQPVHGTTGEEETAIDNEEERRIEHNVQLMTEEIAEKIELDYILQTISCSLLTDETKRDILYLRRNSQSAAVKKMINKIGGLKLQCKWKTFVNCLRTNDYHDIANKLVSLTAPPSSNSTEQWIIAIFNAILKCHIDPEVISTHLVADGVINSNDKQRIHETNREFGCIRAAGLLLKLMQNRQSTTEWYTAFIKTLIKCQHEDLALMIDPDFCEKFKLHQQNSTSLVTPQGCSIDNSLVIKDLEEDVIKYEQIINDQTDTAKQTITSYCKILEKLGQTAFFDLRAIKQRRLGPIGKARILLQQYRVGKIQDLDYLQNEIRNELKQIETGQLIVSPCFELNENLKLAVIQNADERVQLDKQHYRQRKYSDGSYSSTSTGYLEVKGSQDFVRNSSSSDESKGTDKETNSSSVPSSRGSSPSPQYRVSFKEQSVGELSLTATSRIRNSAQIHIRSSSLSDLHRLAISSIRRRRTLSEHSINEDEGGILTADTEKSASLDNYNWVNKIDFQKHEDGHSYFEKIKVNRKRKPSESASTYSDVSDYLLSTVSSQGFTASSCSSLLQVSDISKSTESTASVDRDCSLVLHHKYGIHSGKFVLTDICNVNRVGFAVIDHHAGRVLMYETAASQFRVILCCKNVYKPFKIVWSDTDTVYVLMRTRSCYTKLHLFCSERDRNGKEILKFDFLKNVQFSCVNEVTDIKKVGKQVAASCFNKHIHFIENDQEVRILKLHSDYKEWWPSSIAVYLNSVYVFELYSQTLLCFDPDQGELQWYRMFSEDDGIEGMTGFGGKLFLAQNIKSKVLILSVGRKEPPVWMTFLSEDVTHPFALHSTRTSIMMTQFHPGRNKVNRTVKCF